MSGNAEKTLKRSQSPVNQTEGKKKRHQTKAEAAEQRMPSEEDCEENKKRIIKSGFIIIKEMKEMVDQRQGHRSDLLDELLHSIFFLGLINDGSCIPDEIVTDPDMLNDLKVRHPLPFELYSSQLPRRSPFSCVLDMIVDLTGRENENEIKQKLQNLITKLKKGGATDLVSSTICVSQADPEKKDSVRYYGVSMSTSGSNPGKIMIAASCLSSYWDSYVAGAVMTYYPKKEKKPYFDGTIKIPGQVRCEAFSLSDGRQMPPCGSCGNLFGLKTNETSEEKEWPYGNCAEAESLSNLFKSDEKVRKDVQLSATKCDLELSEKRVQSKLKKLLLELHKQRSQSTQSISFQWKNEFYTPVSQSTK